MESKLWCNLESSGSSRKQRITVPLAPGCPGFPGIPNRKAEVRFNTMQEDKNNVKSKISAVLIVK